MEAPNDTAILVHHVKQEYWYISKQKCPCGGQLKCGAQQLAEQDDVPVDVIQTECDQCGREEKFKFNIASFFGSSALDEQELIRQLGTHVRSEALKRKLPLLSGSPVVHAINTILDLGKSGDRMALDWIADAVRHAQRESETAGSEEN